MEVERKEKIYLQQTEVELGGGGRWLGWVWSHWRHTLYQLMYGIYELP